MPNNYVFIRTKQIKKYHYAYLVENTWKKGRSKQRVVQYLGRVYSVKTPPPAHSLGEDIIKSLLEHELSLCEHNIRIDFDTKEVLKGGKEIVLGLNGGFFCTYTFTELHKALYVRNEEVPGTALAQAFSNAGLRIPQEAFISLYKEYYQ